MRKVDVLIVGAGPAGATCAIVLQRAGHECLLVDKADFPRDKLCGGGLTPNAWHLLDRLHPNLKYDYLPVDHMQLYMDCKYMGRYALDEEIRVVQRRDFDRLLVEQYLAAGGELLRDTLARVEETGDGRIVATMESGERVECRYLVGADGANSRVRRYLAPDSKPGVLIVEQYSPRSEREDIAIELSPDFDFGYLYSFPNQAYDAVGYAESHTDMAKFHQRLERYGIAETKIKGACIAVDCPYPRHDRILLVGDAGAWCDRLSYEGIYYALATGRNAATAILTGRPFAEVNRRIAAKRRHRVLAANILYRRSTLSIVRAISRHRRLTERILNRYLRPDTIKSAAVRFSLQET